MWRTNSNYFNIQAQVRIFNSQLIQRVFDINHQSWNRLIHKGMLRLKCVAQRFIKTQTNGQCPLDTQTKTQNWKTRLNKEKSTVSDLHALRKSVMCSNVFDIFSFPMLFDSMVSARKIGSSIEVTHTHTHIGHRATSEKCVVHIVDSNKKNRT